VRARLTVAALAGLGWLLAGPLTLALPSMLECVWGTHGIISFAVGAVLGGVIGAALLRWAPMLTTLEHELTHLFAAVLLLRRPVALSVGDGGGGHVAYTGRGSSLILLAPYVLPTFTFLGLLLGPLIGDRFGAPYVGLLGATWGFHVWTGVREAHPRQTDLLHGGLLVSYIAVVAWGLIFYPLAAFLTLGGPSLAGRWLRAGLQIARGWLS
jgi:hypothetical protein